MARQITRMPSKPLPRWARTDACAGAGDRYRRSSSAERETMIHDLVEALSGCDSATRTLTIEELCKADLDYGQRVAERLGIRRSRAIT